MFIFYPYEIGCVAACDNSNEVIVFFPNSVLVFGNSYSVSHGVTIFDFVKVIMNSWTLWDVRAGQSNHAH